MKHFTTSLVCLLFILRIFANPIAIPTINISELYFDSLGNWVLELEYNFLNQESSQIDSILLLSSEDTIKLTTSPFIEFSGVIITCNDSLGFDFKINRYGDRLIVKTFFRNMDFDDVLVFGNYDGAVISYPRLGQSIAKYGNSFVKNNSPSLGELNDNAEVFGNLTGIIYNKNFIPVSERKFVMDFQFETSASGNYTTMVYSKPSTFNRINYLLKQFSWGSVAIDEISYEMEPDSMIIRDIYLLDTLQTGKVDVLINSFPIKFYPNPLSISDQLHFEIDLPVKTANWRMEVLTLEGKLLMTRRIMEKKGEIKLGDLKGVIIVNVLMDNKLVSTSRLMVANE
jgi:hypothetical protein